MTIEEKPHILIIDGMALLFRSFFATSAMGHYFPNDAGIPTNAVQGFARHTMTATSIFKPTHMAVCWDMGAQTFRNDLFEGYKANRPAPAPELVPQFDMARSVSELIGWKNYGVPGMEADDLIGSFVQAWEGKAEITIVTGDKDMLQLLRPGVRIAFTKKVLMFTIFTQRNVSLKSMELPLSSLLTQKHSLGIQVTAILE